MPIFISHPVVSLSPGSSLQTSRREGAFRFIFLQQQRFKAASACWWKYPCLTHFVLFVQSYSGLPVPAVEEKFIIVEGK